MKTLRLTAILLLALAAACSADLPTAAPIAADGASAQMDDGLGWIGGGTRDR
jgi:hypothetical protein